MSTQSLPPINGLIDLVLSDGEVFPSRIEDADGKLVAVGAPLGLPRAEMPKPGSALEIAWIVEDARHAVDVRLRSVTTDAPPRWELTVIGAVRLQTRRSFVRGGGSGELTKVIRDGETYLGKIIDLSEGGVRLRVADDSFRDHDEVDVHLMLDGERMPLHGTVLFIRRHPESASYDVIITYQPTEAVGRAIRGYVMRCEMEARRRFRESVAAG
jgi:hypothetical protein